MTVTVEGMLAVRSERRKAAVFVTQSTRLTVVYLLPQRQQNAVEVCVVDHRRSQVSATSASTRPQSVNKRVSRSQDNCYWFTSQQAIDVVESLHVYETRI